MSHLYRKCAKCGKTRAEDTTVTYHRFPWPGIRNVTKARAWANFCWPDKDWSIEALKSLNNKCKVLCARHFDPAESRRQRLSIFAIPQSTEVERILTNQENVFNEDSGPDNSWPSRINFARSSSPGPSTPKRTCIAVDESTDIPIETANKHVSTDGLGDVGDTAYHDLDNDDDNNEKVEDDDVTFLSETEPLVGSVLHTGFKCNVCHGDISGFRYTCVQCEDFDMCASCEARGEHPAHYVLRLPAPKPHLETEPVLSAIRDYIHGLLNLKKEGHQVFVKEEVLDEIQEETETDLTNPLARVNDRSVPEVNLQQNSSPKEIADSADTIKTFPIKELPHTSALKTQLESYPRIVISPLNVNKYKSPSAVPPIEVQRTLKLSDKKVKVISPSSKSSANKTQVSSNKNIKLLTIRENEQKTIQIINQPEQESATSFIRIDTSSIETNEIQNPIRNDLPDLPTPASKLVKIFKKKKMTIQGKNKIIPKSKFRILSVKKS